MLGSTLVIVLVLLAAYSNSFSGPFVFDDVRAIPDNPTLRQLWPLWPALSPPLNNTTTGRPLLNLSFAVNYALGGLNVWGYHAINLAIHISNSLLLFGILRRTLGLPILRDRFARVATRLSLAIALLWAVHPLQTESVTYIVQRAESLGALFYLLTLYCVIRGMSSGRRVGWYCGAVTACLLGMSAKEVMVTAPVAILLYDRTLVAGSFREALRRRAMLHAGLALTWALLIYLLISNGSLLQQFEANRAITRSSDPWSYAATQPSVILHYLRLTVWPSPLVFAYDWPVEKSWAENFPAILVVGTLLAITIRGIASRGSWAFLGAWFFLILSPTSSVVPMFDEFSGPIFEHRMYLPLAAPLAGLVLAGFLLCARLADRGLISKAVASQLMASVIVVLVAIFGAVTFKRNIDYSSDVAIWRDSVDKAPGSPRAHNNLGYALVSGGEIAEGAREYQEALRLRPDFSMARINLENALSATEETGRAIRSNRAVLRQSPESPEAHYSLAISLRGVVLTGEAIRHFREAIRLKPDFLEAHVNLGASLLAANRPTDAILAFQAALKLKPDLAEAHYNLGLALQEVGRADEAVLQYREALRLRPGYAQAYNNIGVVLVRQGRFGEALEQFVQALRINSSFVDAQENLDRVKARINETR